MFSGTKTGGGRGAGAEPRLGKSPTLGVTLFHTKIFHIRVSNFSMKLKDPILYENCGGRVGKGYQFCMEIEDGRVRGSLTRGGLLYPLLCHNL